MQTVKRTFFSSKRRVAQWSLVLIACGIVTLAGIGQIARWNLRRSYPPPGTLYDVGGYRMHLYATGPDHDAGRDSTTHDTAGQSDNRDRNTGNRRPSVILEAGNNDYSIFWASVQDSLSEEFNVYSYDRAGLGWSDSSPLPRTAPEIVDELRTLLAVAEVPPPYILVGHSLGGVHMKLFAHHYPETVAGLVLVDSAHESQLERIPFLDGAIDRAVQQFEFLARLSSMGVFALRPGSIPSRGLEDKEAARYRAVMAGRRQLRGMSEETLQMKESFTAVLDQRIESLGEMPLVVLSRGLSDPLPDMDPATVEAFDREWNVLQTLHTELSTGSRRITAERSGHYIQLDQPDLVVDAIRTVALQSVDVNDKNRSER